MKMIAVLSLVILFSGCGGYSSPTSPTPQPGVVPTISELSPDKVSAGGPGFTLTVNGTSFGSKAVVEWNGAAQTTTFVTAKQLVTTIPASGVATAGTVAVTVTNPGTPGSGGIYGTGGTMSATSEPMNFTIE
jgi:hypothetical protein